MEGWLLGVGCERLPLPSPERLPLPSPYPGLASPPPLPLPLPCFALPSPLPCLALPRLALPCLALPCMPCHPLLCPFIDQLTIRYVSEGCFNLLARTPESMVGTVSHDLVHGRDQVGPRWLRPPPL
jgi:hypothetical protein